MASVRTHICALGALLLLAGATGAYAAGWSAVIASSTPVVSGTPSTIIGIDSGRKGTRSYRPDGSSAGTATPPSIADYAPPTPAEKLQHCIDIWDAGTHISKSKWREICKRQLAAGE